jgi:hypothetical protein
LETTGNARQIAIKHVKSKHMLNEIMQLVIKYWCIKKVFSANQKASMKRNLGLSVKFIQMEQSGFNALLNQRDSTSGGLHLFLRKLKLNRIIT